MSILDKIIEVKRKEVVLLENHRNDLETAAAERQSLRDFKSALLSDDNISIIAEVKKASPSAGVIRPDFDPVIIAKQYQAGGASALSVLTDEKFFQGHIEYLQQVRSETKLPLLRKDFVVSPLQIIEAVARGADAILLIVAILSDAQIKNFRALAEKLGLAVLVEVHDEQELDRALSSGAEIIGINNRNLYDFSVNLEITERLAPKILSRSDAGHVIVAESGIHTRTDVERVASTGVNAILIGESLMRSDDIPAKIKALIGSK